MSQKELDGGLLALMEIHCKEMRKEHGHLRTDKLAADQPIPFPHRQMPAFFALQIATRKDLKLWFQLEKVLFDHYEFPLPIPTYMGVRPRLAGKVTDAGSLRDIIGLDIPPRADIRPVDWDSIFYGDRRGELRVIGGHVDKDINDIGKSGLNMLDLTRQKPIRAIGMDPGGKGDIVVVGSGGGLKHYDFGKLRDIWNPRNFDLDYRFRMIDGDEPPEREHSTDYRKPRGWKRIPKQIPNQAQPSPVLLALLRRSA